MIRASSTILDDTRGSRGAFWLAECTLDDGRTFSTRSRNGAPNALARMLVEANIPDDAMEVFDTRRQLVTLTYRSFYAAAKWTYTEGNRPLKRIPYEAFPDKVDAGYRGRPKNMGEEGAPVGVLEPRCLPP